MDDEKFKEIGSRNEGGAFVVGASHKRSNSHGNNWRRDSRLRSKPRVDLEDRECYYCHVKDHIQYHCMKIKVDLVEFKKFKKSHGK